jgi:integrase
MKFTDKSLKALKAKSERYEVWEDGKTGFGMRISPSGIKTFVWMYRYEGAPKRLTLGNYPKMSLYEANKVLADAKEKLAHGINPGDEAVEQRKRHRNSMLIEILVSEYLERHAKPNKRSASEDERILKKDILPRWGKMKAKDIQKKDVIELLDTILERGSPIIANRTLACIRKMFNWAHSRDLLDSSPCLNIKAPSREARRDRVLTKEEITNLWNNLSNAKMTISIGTAIQLQLVTAQRKSEILKAQWADIDFKIKVWTIPAENAKNGLTHRVPLSDLALKLLARLKSLSNGSFYLFPSHGASTVIQGSSVDHALRKNREILGLKDVTPHDLRRTAASHMASMGVNRLVISKILNHVEQSITSIYDRYSYDKEKREALEKWGAFLEETVEMTT